MTNQGDSVSNRKLDLLKLVGVEAVLVALFFLLINSGGLLFIFGALAGLGMIWVMLYGFLPEDLADSVFYVLLLGGMIYSLIENPLSSLATEKVIGIFMVLWLISALLIILYALYVFGFTGWIPSPEQPSSDGDERAGQRDTDTSEDVKVVITEDGFEERPINDEN